MTSIIFGLIRRWILSYKKAYSNHILIKDIESKVIKQDN